MGLRTSAPIIYFHLNEPYISLTNKRHIDSCGSKYKQYRNDVYLYEKVSQLMTDFVDDMEFEYSYLKHQHGKMGPYRDIECLGAQRKWIGQSMVLHHTIGILRMYIDKMNSYRYPKVPKRYLKDLNVNHKKCELYKKGMKLIKERAKIGYNNFMKHADYIEKRLRQLGINKADDVRAAYNDKCERSRIMGRKVQAFQDELNHLMGTIFENLVQNFGVKPKTSFWKIRCLFCS
ncbi:hypothetical protein ACOME3_004354 [Neoechinorhynchus agilis]